MPQSTPSQADKNSVAMVNESTSINLQKKALDLYKSALTQQDVETIVERSLGPNYQIHNYHTKSYSDENLGFMGAHRNFIVEVSPENCSTKEVHTYFLKSVPYNIDGQAKVIEDSKMFYKETSFFSSIMPELIKSSKDKSWAPQCYLVKDDVLVFENLVVKNYVLGEKYLTVNKLKSALSSLAKMHAASILAEKRLGKTFFEMYPNLMEEIQFTFDGPFAKWCKCGIDVLTNLAKYLELNQEIVPKVCKVVFEKIRPSKTRRNVVCHGDAWSNNLMFKGSKCVLVDFQLMRYIPAMADVTLLILHNAKKELRDEYEVELLKHYHGAFSETLIEGGEVEVPSFEDISEEYEEMRIVGLVTVNMYYQVNKINGKKQVEMMASSEGFNSLLFSDRVALIMEMMETDEEYREVISTALKELIDAAPKYVNCD